MTIKHKRDQDDIIKKSGIAGAQYETIQRYGSAVKEHFKAYSGVDNETGQRLEKGLKDISNSKVNPEYTNSNIKQQAGFSAEVKTAARENAEKIINRKNTTQTTRTDDMVKQSDGRGNTVGGKNEQLYDIAEIDKNGAYIEGSARQLKYVGGDAKSCANKLLGKNFDKYRDADVPIEVPSDFYDDVISDLSKRSDQIRKNIENAEKKGDIELANKHKATLEKIEQTKRNLKKGKLTNKEAIEARVHPVISTAKDIHKISHKAGLQGAKIGATLGGGMSAIQNIVSVVKGDKSASEAIFDATEDTIKATAISYTTSYVGTAIKGAMQNAPSKYLQSLSKSNLPAVLVTTTIEVGKTLSKFANGEIDGTECLVQLGEKGSGMTASSLGAAIGQALIPVPIIGGLIGGMIGYAMSSAFYNELVDSLKNAKLAHEERLYIEAECQQAIAAIKEYRAQIQLIISNYMQEYMSAFDSAFLEMEEAYCTNNINDFIVGVNHITKKLGGNTFFETQEELDEIMSNEQIIII